MYLNRFVIILRYLIWFSWKKHNHIFDWHFISGTAQAPYVLSRYCVRVLYRIVLHCYFSNLTYAWFNQWFWHHPCCEHVLYWFLFLSRCSAVSRVSPSIIGSLSLEFILFLRQSSFFVKPSAQAHEINITDIEFSFFLFLFIFVALMLTVCGRVCW